MNDLVSVIITTHNRLEFLKNALVEVTRGTVATDPCTFEGPSPGGDGSQLPGT